ncbi:MAG: glycosyltransferase, partial [Oscillospiraceae bacterium]|nr:glycosyltransferase [Oscillospiraceae bacterium]
IQNAADFELYNKTLPPSRQITELNIVERMSAKASALLEARCHDYTCVELHALLLELISSLKGYGVDELQTKYAALRILAHCFTWERSSAMRKLLCSYLESPEFSSLDLDSLSYDECPSSVRQAFDVLRAVKPAYEFRAKLDLSAEDKHCKCVAESSVAQSPKVSVIIPVYNVENYLPKCLDSVLQQTLQEIEIVCVSDGSPDGSLEILMDYAKRYPNLKVLTQENGGLSVARNNGLKYANGEYIHFLDSDDTMELGAYEFLYSTAAEQDLDLLFFDANSVYETEDLKQAYPWYLHGYHSQKESDQVQSGSQYYINAVNDKTFRLSACMYIVRREFLLQAGITFQEGITHEDNYFTNAVSTLSSRTSHVSIPFYNRLVHEGSLTIQDIQFRHCYGYFASFLAMQHFIYTKLEDPKLVAAAQIKMSEMLQHAKENYDRISDPAQKYFYLTLPEQELSSFYTLIILPQNISENALLLRERLTETFKEKSEINAKLQLTYKEKFDRGVTIKEQKAKLKEQKAIIKEQKTQLKQLKAEKKALQQELNALKTKHGKLKKSLSYRIGRYLTWPFRKLKALFSKK